MKPPIPQYALGLSLPPVFSAANFLTGDSNREAWHWVKSWPEWPAHALLLYGPTGSGKSHLGHIWAHTARATILCASELTGSEPARGHILVEDIETLREQTHLLHLFNYTRENSYSLLLTSTPAPKLLPFSLPDLTSRLLSLPSARIDEADDALLAGVMRKQFSDRQMKVDDEVIAYTLPRIERSLAKVKELVERLDTAALAEHKNITIPFVKRVLDAEK